MSIILQDSLAANKNPTNNSLSKQIWSFSKERRFSPEPKERYK